jgi:FkbM family methyltransferase
MNMFSTGLYRRIKKWIEGYLNIKIYSNHAHGREDWFDIKKTGHPVMTIFDVGANVGQSAVKFRSAFPESRIYCFEPVASVFNSLLENLKSDGGVCLQQIALAETSGQRTIYLTADPTTSSFMASENVKGAVSVSVSTVDEYAEEQAIGRIDLLRVYAEVCGLILAFLGSGGRNAATILSLRNSSSR